MPIKKDMPTLYVPAYLKVEQRNREIKPMRVSELFIRNNDYTKSQKKTRSPINY